MAADDANYGSGGPAPSGGHPVPAGGSPSHSETMAQAGADPMIGQIIDGRYKVLSKIGEGGMGEVYACEHIGLKKKRAIKLLRAEIVTNEEAVRRFHQEAQSASSIGHKNIIEIVDIGVLPDKRVYMCMEFLAGLPLNEMLKQPLEPARALNILIQTCDGLAAAHRQHIVHRDMKPENIFVTVRDGQEIPKLLDFGIAKVSGNDGQNNLTRTGTIFGTPFYMAPEQALGQTVDHRADVYSLGVIMYEIFTGTVPFKADSFMAILTQHITTEPKPPDQMAAEHGRVIPPGLTEVINRCMRKEPNERYSTIDELKSVLVERYRAIAGAGMSAYYDAQGVPSRPMTAQGVAYPMGTGPQAMAPGPTPMPTPMPMAHAPMHPGAMSGYSAGVQPKKGKAWLWVLILLFLGGGGAGGFLYWQSQQNKHGAGAAGGGVAVAGGLGDTTASDAAPDEVEPDEVKPDEVKPDGPVITDVTPPVKMLSVLINSKPQKAQVFINNESQGYTPTIVEIPEGRQTALLLVRSGYRDATVVLDGKKKKVTERLKRKRHSSGGDKDHGAGTGSDGKPNPFNGHTDKDKDKDKIEDGLIDDDSDQLE